MWDRRCFRAIAMLAMGVTYAVASGPELFFGRWKQLFDKSGGTIQPALTSAIVEIKPVGNRVSVSMSEKSEAGATNSDEYIFSLDGSPVKNAAGMETGRSFRQLDSSVWEWTNKTPQQQTTGHYVVSRDGKTLTITGRRQRSDGSIGYIHRVFEKQ